MSPCPRCSQPAVFILVDSLAEAQKDVMKGRKQRGRCLRCWYAESDRAASPKLEV